MSEVSNVDLKRMMLSRQVLAGLEEFGLTGRPEDSARMIREEVVILEGFIARYPDRAGTLGAVIERYRVLLRGVEH